MLMKSLEKQKNESTQAPNLNTNILINASPGDSFEFLHLSDP